MTTRQAGRWACVGLCGVLCLGAGGTLRAGEIERKLKSDPTQEYYVYLPDKLDPEKRYWLFVGVHGLGGNGKGAMGWAGFANEGQCIVVGPSFTGTFQFPSNSGAEGKMISIFKELHKEYKLHPKMFVTGFSAGAQFAHRFALENPNLVIACAAHSGGSWSSPTPRARGVPFVVTCGEDDKERIQIAKDFADQLKKKYFKVTSAWYPGVGHSFCADAQKLTKNLYWTATTGMTPEQREQALTDLENADKLIGEGKFAEAAKLLQALASSKRKTEYTDRAVAALRQIDKAGKEKLAEIEEQAKTDPRAAAAAFKKLLEDFKGTPAAAAAMRRLQEIVAGAGTAPSQEVKPKDTSASEPKPKPEPTPLDKEEKARKDCARWLSLARNYIANANKPLARRYLEKIIETYPDSAEAKEADKLLLEL